MHHQGEAEQIGEITVVRCTCGHQIESHRGEHTARRFLAEHIRQQDEVQAAKDPLLKAREEAERAEVRYKLASETSREAFDAYSAAVGRYLSLLAEQLTP